MSAADPVSLFYSYAHEDEKHRQDLEGHLKILERRGLLKSWHDRKIVPGQGWQQEIDRNLYLAELILLLISKDFIESDYIWGKELQVAMQRNDRGEARVVPILVRALNIEADDAPFMKLQGLPENLLPVTSWPNVDEAWANVAKGLRTVVNDIQATRAVAPAAPTTAPAGRAASAPPKVTAGIATTVRRAGVYVAQRMRKWLWYEISGPADIVVVLPGGDYSTEGPPTMQAAADDHLLQQVIDVIVKEVEQASAGRGGPPLDAATVRSQLLRLIDMPQQKRVLWVDDRPEGNHHEIATLAKLQIEVITVRTIDEAMRRIESDPEAFDVVISDWSRPAEGAEAGLKLLRRLRAAKQGVPVVYYHGEFDPERRAARAEQARAAGAAGEATLPGELLSLVIDALS